MVPSHFFVLYYIASSDRIIDLNQYFWIVWIEASWNFTLSNLDVTMIVNKKTKYLEYKQNTYHMIYLPKLRVQVILSIPLSTYAYILCRNMSSGRIFPVLFSLVLHFSQLTKNEKDYYRYIVCSLSAYYQDGIIDTDYPHWPLQGWIGITGNLVNSIILIF